MFVKLPLRQQEAILSIKIQEVEVSNDLTENDKKLMKKFYRDKLRKINPNTKF